MCIPCGGMWGVCVEHTWTFLNASCREKLSDLPRPAVEKCSVDVICCQGCHKLLNSNYYYNLLSMLYIWSIEYLNECLSNGILWLVTLGRWSHRSRVGKKNFGHTYKVLFGGSCTFYFLKELLGKNLVHV